MVDFTSLLSKSASDVEKPEPIPAGAYDMAIVGFTTGESAQKKTPYVEIEHKIISPREDVDMEAYAKVKNPQDRSLKTQFYITEDSLFRLKDYLEKAGFETQGRQFLEMLNEIAGHQIVGIVTHRMSQDGESVFSELKKFLKAE